MPKFNARNVVKSVMTPRKA